MFSAMASFSRLERYPLWVGSGNSPARLRTTIPGAIWPPLAPVFFSAPTHKKILGAAQTNSGLADLLDLDNGLALG